MKKLSFLFVVLALMACVMTASAQKLEGLEIMPDGPDMFKYGHLNVAIEADELLKTFEIGDLVTVTVDGQEPFDVPVCSNFDDVFIGERLLRTVPGREYLTLAINYGQLGTVFGIVEPAPAGSDFAFQLVEGVEFPIHVTIEMKEKGGYADRLVLSLLTRTNDINDYQDLTPAEFANFREITTTGIKPGTLYRSANPVRDDIGRNKYADEAAREAGIKTFINLSDSENVAKAYPDFEDSYYSTQNVIFLALPITYTSNALRDSFAEGMRFIINNDGPYLFHCVEGKDRAGLTAAILEALMGASLEEIQDDYAQTYINYYDVQDGKHVGPEPAVMETIRDIIVRNLEYAFYTPDIEDADLQLLAESFMQGIGLTEDEITALKARLAE